MATGDSLTHGDLDAVLEGTVVNESVIQQIIDVSRLPLVLSDKLGSSSVGNKRYDNTMDRLEAPGFETPIVDGFDPVVQNDAVTGQRVSNQQQISIRAVEVSLLGEAANSIGSMGKISRQVNRRGQEIMRGIEASVIANQAAVEDDGSTAGQTAGLEAWIDGKTLIPAITGAITYNQTNARIALSTPAPISGGWDNRTASTNLCPAWDYALVDALVAIDEASLNDVFQAIYENTGDRKNRLGMSRPVLHRKVSSYYFTSSARVATLISDTGTSETAATAKGAVNAILSDWFICDLEANTIMQPSALAADITDTVDADSFFVLDTAQMEFANMTGFRVEPLAKTGLTTRRLLSKSWGLRMLSSEAQGIIQGIDSSLAMIAAQP